MTMSLISQEYRVSYPASLAHIPEEQRLCDAQGDYAMLQEELGAKGYHLFQAFPTGMLWQRACPDTHYPEFILVLFYESYSPYCLDYVCMPTEYHPLQDPPLRVCCIQIPALMDLLGFAYSYHLPLRPPTPDEEAAFINAGYEFVMYHLHAVAAWPDEAHLHALFHLAHACQEAPWRWEDLADM